MTPDHYQLVLGAFDALVAHGRAISDRLAGRQIDQKYLSYSDAIYTKLLCHAISLRKLSPSLEQTATPELWDVASASAVARALIESFDALAYIGIHAVSASERQFRTTLWELHDQQRRLKMLERIGSSDPRVADIRSQSRSLVATLSKSELYVGAGKHLRKAVESGDAPPFHLSQRELNLASAVDHDYYTAATMFLSQYVHTYPFSLHQLMEFRAGEPDALHVSSMPLQYSLAFLAKAIVGMVKIWPAGNVDPSPGVRAILEKWLAIAEQGVRSDG